MTIVKQELDAGNHIGESPIWCPQRQILWWINCEKEPAIYQWSPESGRRQSWPMPSRIGGLALKGDAGLIVALADGVYDFDPLTNDLTLRARSPLPEHVMLHEGQCDRNGRFWVGAFDHNFPASREAAEAAWFRLDGDTLTPVIEGISVANGLAFSPDGRTLYCADTPRRRVEAYDIDPDSGAISNCRTFLTLPPGEGHIDGATVDSEGGYWLAIVGIGVLRRYLDDGTIEREIAMPCSNPTKPAFGGANMDTIFVTSTQMKIGVESQTDEANGSLFSLKPGFAGIPETPSVT